jgi:hypothetical protein
MATLWCLFFDVGRTFTMCKGEEKKTCHPPDRHWHHWSIRYLNAHQRFPSCLLFFPSFLSLTLNDIASKLNWASHLLKWEDWCLPSQRRRGNGVAPAADCKLHESSSTHYHWPVLFNRRHYQRKITVTRIDNKKRVRAWRTGWFVPLHIRVSKITGAYAKEQCKGNGLK